jgi:hypothetical protein
VDRVEVAGELGERQPGIGAQGFAGHLVGQLRHARLLFFSAVRLLGVARFVAAAAERHDRGELDLQRVGRARRAGHYSLLEHGACAVVFDRRQARAHLDRLVVRDRRQHLHRAAAVDDAQDRIRQALERARERGEGPLREQVRRHYAAVALRIAAEVLHVGVDQLARDWRALDHDLRTGHHEVAGAALRRALLFDREQSRASERGEDRALLEHVLGGDRRARSTGHGQSPSNYELSTEWSDADYHSVAALATPPCP